MSKLKSILWLLAVVLPNIIVSVVFHYLTGGYLALIIVLGAILAFVGLIAGKANFGKIIPYSFVYPIGLMIIVVVGLILSFNLLLELGAYLAVPVLTVCGQNSGWFFIAIPFMTILPYLYVKVSSRLFPPKAVPVNNPANTVVNNNTQKAASVVSADNNKNSVNSLESTKVIPREENVIDNSETADSSINVESSDEDNSQSVNQGEQEGTENTQ